MLLDRRRRRGQGVVEYGLILGGTVLVTLITLVFLGPILADVLSLIGEIIDGSS